MVDTCFTFTIYMYVFVYIYIYIYVYIYICILSHSIPVFDNTFTKMLPQDTKQIFASLQESSSAAAAEQRVTWAKSKGFTIETRLTNDGYAVCMLV